jgi:hypothetical protein
MLFMHDFASNHCTKEEHSLACLPDLTFGESVGMTSRLPFDENVALVLDQGGGQVRDFDKQDITLSMHDAFFVHSKLLSANGSEVSGLLSQESNGFATLQYTSKMGLAEAARE